MKYIIRFIFILIYSAALGQNTVQESFQTTSESIEIVVEDLDEIKIINSSTNTIEARVVSLAEKSLTISTEEFNNVLKVKIEANPFNEDSGIFRKYITQRIHKASAVIQLPKNKEVIILGKYVDVISENYEGSLSIFIDKGYVNLNEVKKNAMIKLFQGNIHFIAENTDFEITTSKGRITKKGQSIVSPYIQKTKSSDKTIKIDAINANVFIDEK